VSRVGPQQPVAPLGSTLDEAGLIEADDLAVQRGQRHPEARRQVTHAELLIRVQQQPHQQLRLVLRAEHRKQGRSVATHNPKISPG
jgi:hypothetical protein